jgi:hypothetical protein
LEHLVPLTIRHGTMIALVAIPQLIVVAAWIASARIKQRLRRRVRAAMEFVDKPDADAPDPADGELIVAVGRLTGTQGGKPVPQGTELLDARGDTPVELDSLLCIARPGGRVLLVGQYRVLVGAREGLPIGKGRRVLRAGDKVIVTGRFSREPPIDSTYREAAPRAAIIPSYDVLEIAFDGMPGVIGLSWPSIVRGIFAGALLWVFIFIAGAFVALESARGVASERNMVRLASFAYTSPLTHRKAEGLLRSRVSLDDERDTNFAERWAAIEAFLDGNGECLGALDNLRARGRLEDEARMGLACGGVGSRRRAADAYGLMGEFALAAKVLHAAPPLEGRRVNVPDARLDIRNALVTGDLAGAAALLRRHDHPSLTPVMQECVALSLEARAGSTLSRAELSSRTRSHWTCALLQADLLDGPERLTMLKELDHKLRPSMARPFFYALLVEVDPANGKLEFRFYDPAPLLNAPAEAIGRGYVRAIEMSALERIEAMADVSYWAQETRVGLQAELGMFAASVGEEAESIKLVDRAIQGMPTNHERAVDVRRLAATLSVRFCDPRALKHIEELERMGRFANSGYLRSALSVRAGEGIEHDYYAMYVGPNEVVEATRRGNGEGVLRYAYPENLLRHLIVVGPRIQTGRRELIDKVRWYDPDCLGIPCPLEYLAGQAATRALILSHLRASDVGRGDDQRMLAERARKLREPLWKRDIAMAMVLVDQPYPIDWW